MTTELFSASERAGVYRAIHSRRDIRNFRPDELPEDVLFRLLDAAHHAPSVGLMQPWDFIVLRDRAIRQRLYEHFRDVNARAAEVYPDDRAETYRALKLQGVLDAPLNLIVTCDRRRGGPHVLGRFTMRHMDEYSTCLAVQNLWLAARAEGVGVGWLSVLRPEFVADLVGLPPEVVPVAYLALGYPTFFPKQPMLHETGWAARESLVGRVFLDRHGSPHPSAAAQSRAASAASAARALRLEDDGELQPKPEANAAPVPPRALRRQAELTKPVGSLGRLEELALELAALQQAEHPRCNAPRLLLFAADHGIAREGVSAYLPRATTQMVYQYLSGAAAANVLCRQHAVGLEVVDVGVDHDFGEAHGLWRRKVRRGTRSFLEAPAMTLAEMNAAIAVGAELVRAMPRSDVIALGEMGIGNTTSASAILAALSGAPVEEAAGRGTGIADATLLRKRDVIQRGLERHAVTGATEALRCLGGLELAALVGAIEAAAETRRMVVLDGFITGVAALVARERRPSVARVLVAAHVSAEPAHSTVLAALRLRPLLDLDLRLGEGTGAVLGMALVQSAVRLMREMRTFEEANVERPLDPRDRPTAAR